MSEFKEKVIEIVKSIPYGAVASYGQVAVMAGVPRAARQVGTILNKFDGEIEIPWWRVVNNNGRITIKGSTYTPYDQKSMLESEGLEIKEDFTLDIGKYRFIPNIKTLRRLKLDDEYIETLMRKYAA